MITEITIKGYKTIQDLTFKLAPINILIGANGVGKSNFISFFKLLENIAQQNLKNYSLQEGAENLLYRGGKFTEEIFGRIEVNNIYAYEVALAPSNESSLFIKEERGFYNKNLFSEEGNWFPFSFEKGAVESSLFKSLSFLGKDITNFLKPFRIYHFHDTSSTAKIKQKGNINDNRALRADAGNLAAYLYYLQQKESKAFKQIELTIQSVAPFFDRFVLQPDRLREDTIQLEWREKDSDMYLNASHISDGTLRFMALATLLLQPKAPEVIIIDEPELGLHPFAINKLAGLLRKASKKSQIIVATQSMNLIDNFNPEDIVTIDREDNQSVLKRLDSEALKTWLDDYHSLSTLWNKNVLGGTP